MTKCPKCGNNLSPVHSRFCSVCYYPLLDAEETTRQRAAKHQGIPWENIIRLGLWSALVLTLKKCLTTPATFFTDLAASRNSYGAWLFALMIGSIGSIFNFFWLFFLVSPLLSIVPGLDAYTGKNLLSAGQLIFAPLIITAKLLCIACYFHFLLYVTHSNHQKFWATFRIVCYTQSTAIFNCVPLIGYVISLTWSLYLLSIGFNKIHKISMLRAWLLILMLPVVLSIFAGAIAGLLLGTGSLMLDMFKEFSPFSRY
jgi:hypothetical protein